MPRATLCGLSRRFAVREVVLPRLFCPGSSGRRSRPDEPGQNVCVHVVAYEKTCVSATQGGRGRKDVGKPKAEVAEHFSRNAVACGLPLNEDAGSISDPVLSNLSLSKTETLAVKQPPVAEL